MVHRLRNNKRLIEEIVPLGVLARSKDLPQSRVSCRYTGKSSHEPDGILKIRGWLVNRNHLPANYLVEMTTAAHPNAHLMRELLSTHEIVYGGGHIEATGTKKDPNRKIISKPVVGYDDAKEHDTNSELVKAAIKQKSKKEYPSNTILAINLRPEGILTLQKLAKIEEDNRLIANASNFLGVYLIYIEDGLSIRLK